MRNLLIAAALASATVASAQIEAPTNVSLRIGFAYPLDDTTRDVVRNFIGVGFDYYFDRSLLPGGETTLSVDWLGKSSSGSKGNVFPILLNQRFYGPSRGEDEFSRNYFFAGAGIAVVDVTDSKTVLAARVGVGREFSEKLFGEITLVHSDNANGARASNIGFHFGYRF